jgi:hypothetical protein
LSGVDVVREQVAALLPPEAALSVSDGALIVWQGDAKVRYDLNEPETLQPRLMCGTMPDPQPSALARKAVVFGETELLWNDWVKTWEQDRSAIDVGKVPADLAAPWPEQSQRQHAVAVPENPDLDSSFRAG